MNLVNSGATLPVPLFNSLFEMKKVYFPDAPDKCPLPPQGFAYNITLKSAADIKLPRFWGNMNMPNGLYKFVGKAHSKEDPEGVSGEYVIEVKNHMGDVVF
jgi:hypothetical protein